MKKYVYQGVTIKNPIAKNLIYYSNAELHNGLIEVTHVDTVTIQYYTKQEFNKLFKPL